MKQFRKPLLLALTIVIFFILILKMDYQKALEIIRLADPTYLILAFFLTFLFPLFCAIRWNLIVFQLETDLGLWESFKIIMAAWPLGSITPAKSGDLIKVVFLENVLPYSKTTGVILAERVMDFGVLCLYALFGGLLFGFNISVAVALMLLCGTLSFFFIAASSWVSFVPIRWRTLALNFLEATQKICHHWRSFIIILLVTFINWFCTFLQIWLSYRALNIVIPISYILTVLPIAIFIGLIPITIAGMGTRDSAIIYLFDKYAPYEANLAIGILYSFFGYWILSLLGIPFTKSALQGSIGGIRGEELRRKVFAKQKNPDRTD